MSILRRFRKREDKGGIGITYLGKIAFASATSPGISL